MSKGANGRLRHVQGPHHQLGYGDPALRPTYFPAIDGKSRTEVWTVVAEEEDENDGEVFNVTEGDELEFDGTTFTPWRPMTGTSLRS